MTEQVQDAINRALKTDPAQQQLNREGLKEELRRAIEAVDSGEFMSAIITLRDANTRKNRTTLWGHRELVQQSAVLVLQSAGILQSRKA